MALESIALKNGRIWTGTRFATNVLICGSRIASVDGDLPAAARAIDLRGRLAVPGFIDNHLHFILGSLQFTRVQLRDAASPEEFARRIAAHAANLGPGRWVTGGGFDEQRWQPAALPTRHLIDPLTPDNPVFVSRLDVHMGLANTMALELAGITRETPDPPGGTIVRDDQGEPTGVLKDAAMSYVSAVISHPTLDERMTAIQSGLREAARLGVTSFCDMGMSLEAFDDFRAYQRIERNGELTARVSMYTPIGAYERILNAGIERAFGGERLRIGGLKGFADGSLGSSTAAFRQPFDDEPGNCGLLMHSMEDGSMARWIREADAHEMQIAIHAIGDRANDEVLSLLEARPHCPTRRFRIEHAQHLDASLMSRFAQSNVIASMQPYHAIDDGRWAERKVGVLRAKSTYAFRSLLDAGATVTFGSDWPVAPLDPILGIDAAVNRRTLDGRNPNGWIPEQKISVADALRCYSANNAYAMFAEREIGAIAPGMLADIVVLSDDLFSIAPGSLDQARVEKTIFNGEVIYES